MTKRIGSRFKPIDLATLPTYLIVCEGLTEEQYFKHWKRRLSGKVNMHIHGERGVPLTLVEEAIKEKVALLQAGIASEQIHTWCVGDRDAHPFVVEALDRAQAKEINYALSTPCIELWFILHFKSQNAHIERRDAIHQSKALLNLKRTKNLDTPALDALFVRTEDALTRARKLETDHGLNSSGRLANPGSGLYLLVQQLKAF